MNRHSANLAAVSVIAIGCAALMATPIAVADSQGITAPATTAKADPARELTALRQQVQALEKRVAELEEGDLEESKGDEGGTSARRTSSSVCRSSKRRRSRRRTTAAERLFASTSPRTAVGHVSWSAILDRLLR